MSLSLARPTGGWFVTCLGMKVSFSSVSIRRYRQLSKFSSPKSWTPITSTTELSRNEKLLRRYSSTVALSNDDTKKTVSITYVEAKDGTAKKVDAEIGMDLMNVAHENNIDLEGACGGELACSTCHLIFEKKIFDTLPEMEEEEVDMLDLAFEVTDTSRLGCQIIVTEDFDGMTVTIPDDGF